MHKIFVLDNFNIVLDKKYFVWADGQGKRLEVSENLKFIAVTSRASKLQVFKVQPGRALNLGHPRESLNIGILTHAGGPGSNPGKAELWSPWSYSKVLYIFGNL